MQKIIISNVKNSEYKDTNLNKICEPDKQHKQSFEFQQSTISNPFAVGGGKLSVNFYKLQPGKANYPYHYHTENEEVFYIINGHGTLKTPEGDRTVSEGDVIIMPASKDGAHMLLNTSSAPLVYLDVDTVNSAEVVFYPETEKIAIIMDGKVGKTFKISTAVNYLDGE